MKVAHAPTTTNTANRSMISTRAAIQAALAKSSHLMVCSSCRQQPILVDRQAVNHQSCQTNTV